MNDAEKNSGQYSVSISLHFDVSQMLIFCFFIQQYDGVQWFSSTNESQANIGTGHGKEYIGLDYYGTEPREPSFPHPDDQFTTGTTSGMQTEYVYPFASVALLEPNIIPNHFPIR